MAKAAPNATLTILIGVPVTWEALGAVVALPANASVTIKPVLENTWAAIVGDNTQNLVLSSGALEIQNANITGTHSYTVASTGTAVSLAFTNSRFEPSGVLSASLVTAAGSGATLVVTNTNFTNIAVNGEAGLRSVCTMQGGGG
jgi:hypothetical protein